MQYVTLKYKNIDSDCLCTADSNQYYYNRIFNGL